MHHFRAKIPKKNFPTPLVAFSHARYLRPLVCPPHIEPLPLMKFLATSYHRGQCTAVVTCEFERQLPLRIGVRRLHYLHSAHAAGRGGVRDKSYSIKRKNNHSVNNGIASASGLPWQRTFPSNVLRDFVYIVPKRPT